MRYTSSYARTHLSRLMRQAAAGEEVVVMRGSKAIAKIVPISGAGNEREKRGEAQEPDGAETSWAS